MTNLQEFHHAEEGSDKTHKIVGLVAIAVIVGGIAVYVVESGMLSPAPSQAGQTYPRGM